MLSTTKYAERSEEDIELNLGWAEDAATAWGSNFTKEVRGTQRVLCQGSLMQKEEHQIFHRYQRT